MMDYGVTENMAEVGLSGIGFDWVRIRWWGKASMLLMNKYSKFLY